MKPHEMTPWPANLESYYRETGVWAGIDIFSAIFSQLTPAEELQVALIDGEKEWSFGKLRDEAESLAQLLVEQGVQPGERALLQMDNGANFVITLLALLRMGAQAIMAHPAHRKSELLSFVEVASPTIYLQCLSNRAAAESCKEAIGNCYRAPNLFVDMVDGSVQKCHNGENDYRHFLNIEALFDADIRQELKTLPPPPNASDIALLQLSGGSTATPKLIPRTHDDYLYSIAQSVAICGWNDRVKYLAVLPMAHNFTLSSPGVLGSLFAKGVVVCCPHPAPSVALSLVKRHQISHIALVPALLEQWVNYAQDRAIPIANQLRAILVGGAALRQDLAARSRDIFRTQLQQVYGMAEGLVCYTRLYDNDEVVLGTQGRPMSKLDSLRVVDSGGQLVKNGEPGELQCSGPYTIRGYYLRDPEQDPSFTEDGFYRTGDIVRLRDDGNLVVVGRVKEQINRAGEKISTPEVESAIAEIEGIKSVAVVGIPDDVLGERSVAFVCWKQIERDLQFLRSTLRDRGWAEYKLPDSLVTVESLPLSPVGKIDKRELLNRYVFRQ